MNRFTSMCVRILTINAVTLAMLFAPTINATSVGDVPSSLKT